MSLETLAQKLVGDLELRRQFAADPRSVLGREGLDPTAFEVPDKMSLAELDKTLAAWFQARTLGTPSSPAWQALSIEAASARGGPHRPLTCVLREPRSAVSAPSGQPLPPFARREVEDSSRTRRGARAKSQKDAKHAAQGGDIAGSTDNLATPGEPAESAKDRPDPSLSEAQGSHRAPVQARESLPDAWEASFRPLSVRALLRTPEVRRSIEEAVIVEDDRQPVENADERPFRWICSLVITAANGTRWQGTGWVVGPRTVITAGHVVYMPSQGGWVSAVEVYPGRSAELQPPAATAAELHSVQGWVQEHVSAYDYGALTLSQPLQEGYGYFGFAACNDATLSSALINIAGYPTDKPMGTMWGNTRRLSSVGTDVLLYTIDTFGGMSGAPLVHWDAGDFIVVGIHNYGDVAGNLATRINRDVFRNIELWRSLNVQPSSNQGYDDEFQRA